MQLHPTLMQWLRDFQIEGVRALYNYFEEANGNPLLCYPTGCHAKGTEILMYDGSVKLVEDVQVGDLLMGPDSTSREVLNLARGNEQMVRVVPTKGDSFVVNINHILSLYKVNERSDPNRISPCSAPSICNISAGDYLKKSKHFKHLHKLRKASIDFENKDTLPISPYFLGLYIGDGYGKGFSFNSIDKCLIDEFVKEIDRFWGKYSITLDRRGGSRQDCYIAKIKNVKHSHLCKKLRELKLDSFNSENVFIPHIYKTALKKDRIELLSGLIDTDGHLCWSGSYDYISKSIQLANDIVFVCRSLGLAAYLKPCEKYSQNGTGGTYYRVSISGDLSILNCRLQYKRGEKRQQMKRVDITSFKVELLENDNFYGFALDKDHLYLTGDFTIHHNTGKSFVNAAIAFDVLMKWPNQRILMLTHVKKLIEQNLEKLLILWPNAPVGIYSAGLNQKDTIQPLIFGAVASVVNAIDAFGHRDLIIIDEAHLVSPDENTMYQIIIKRLTEINPFLKVIGLTATPYRAGQGLLTDNGLFTDICFDLTGIEPFNRFIEEGYLAPLIPKRTNIEIDTSDIKINRGDFAQNQLNDATEKVLYEALKETVERAYDRNCWLVFCSGIKPSEHAAEILQSFGVSALAIHSKLTPTECDKRFAAFEHGEVKAIVGNNKFTTGFDFAPIDFICMLRSTMSTNLWVQMLGRGTRPYDCNNLAKYIPGFDYIKYNCLVLDFGGNSKRLGPVNDPQLPRKKGDKEGEMPIKICANDNTKNNKGCGIYNHPSARFCGGKPYPSNEGCGAEFVFKTKLVKTAGTDELIKGINFEHTIETFNVDKVIYHRHNKIGSEPSIKVSYWSGLKRFTEYVCLQHKGYARTRALNWWRQRSALEPPATTDEALLRVSQLRCPKQIKVRVDTQYPEIQSVEW